MLAHFRTLLESIANHPDERVSALPLLLEDERRQLLHGWNPSEHWFRQDVSLHRLFEARAEQAASATALIFEGASISYDELNRRANRLAHTRRIIPSTRAGPTIWHMSSTRPARRVSPKVSWSRTVTSRDCSQPHMIGSSSTSRTRGRSFTPMPSTSPFGNSGPRSCPAE